MLAAVTNDDSALVGEPREIASKRLRRVGGNANFEVLFHADARPVVRKIAQAPQTAAAHGFGFAGGVVGRRKSPSRLSVSLFRKNLKVVGPEFEKELQKPSSARLPVSNESPLSGFLISSSGVSAATLPARRPKT